MEHPKKQLAKLIRDYGGSVAQRNRMGITYAMPDGAAVYVSEALTHPQMVDHRRALHRRYGVLPGSGSSSRVHRSGQPILDLERVTASDHAKIRLGQMKRQAGVDLREVLHCLRLPERVLWSEEHGSWLWVRDRLAVAVAESGDGFVITTVMWSSADLFVQHPRPEAARA